jgi:hypothetical protein
MKVAFFLVFSLLGFSALSQQVSGQVGDIVQIDIKDKQYQPPPITQKIPQSFKDGGTRLAVRPGDTIKICNKDVLVVKPFSDSPGNKFNEAKGNAQDPGIDQYGDPTNPRGVGVGSNPGLRTGACMSYTVHNGGNEPISLKLFDEIHANNKIFLVVLPANWPYQGYEKTPPDPRALRDKKSEYLVGETGQIVQNERCDAGQTSLFSKFTGTWKTYAMSITISGSCDEATGAYHVAEYCSDVNGKDQSETYHGAFTGRMEGESVSFNWAQEAGKRHPKLTGTATCSINKDGTLSCSGFGPPSCGPGDAKKQ